MPTPAREITSNLAFIRQQQGLSAASLAGMVGISRQTIYSLESGTYVPNTAVGLRLAKALGVTVDDLFSLAADDLDMKSKAKTATLLPPAKTFYPGQPVQLCQVNRKLIAAASEVSTTYLPASDAAISGSIPVRGKARVNLYQDGPDLGKRLLLAGCDPALTVLARHLQPLGIDIVLLHQNSSESLKLLKSGHVHMAGTHLRDEASGESNLAIVRKLFPKVTAAVVSFAVSEEGLLTAPGNPKQIKGVQDLGRQDVTFLNRETGSGSRRLLDAGLQKLNLEPKSVRGYLQTAGGHLAAASQVKSGAADCCMATLAAARLYGLHFIPLASVRYDLVVRRQHLSLPGIQTLFHAINRSAFRMCLKNTGGYDTTVTGTRIQ